MTQAAIGSTGVDQRPARSVWSRLSLRTRVAVNVIAITGLIQLVLGLVVFQYFQTTVNDFFDSRLATRLRWASNELAKQTATRGIPDDAMLEGIADRTIRLASLVLVLRDTDGRVVATSDSAVELSHLAKPRTTDLGEVEPAIVSMPNIGGSDDERAPARTVTLRVLLRQPGGGQPQPYYLTAAISNTPAMQMTELVGRAVLLASTLGLIATGCAAWFITGLALKPLNQLQSVAQQFSIEKIDHPAPLQPQSPEIERLAAELDAARNRIRQVLLANERFIANVSHELKTPVAVLRTEAQTLDATDIPAQTRSFVRSVIEETRRLGSMVDSFLTLASVRSGRALNATRPVYINDTVIESLAQCSVVARQRGITLVPDFHEGDHDLVVAGDADLLRALIDNLIRNAIRFSPADTPVHVETSADEASVTMSVVDSGPGIPSELLPTLFERFAQASPEAVVGRGHGLGLSIAQGIAELHGGLITTSNRAGGGCRFTFTLPRLKLPPLQSRTASTPPPPPAPSQERPTAVPQTHAQA